MVKINKNNNINNYYLGVVSERLQYLEQYFKRSYGLKNINSAWCEIEVEEWLLDENRISIIVKAGVELEPNNYSEEQFYLNAQTLNLEE